MQRESMFGSGTYYNQFEGLVPNLERRFRETNSEWVKEEIALVMSSEECPACHGRRLKPDQPGRHGRRHQHCRFL